MIIYKTILLLTFALKSSANFRETDLWIIMRSVDLYHTNSLSNAML